MIKNYDEFVNENYSGDRANVKGIKRFRKYLAALEMNKKGKSMDEIRLATGWFKGRYDEKWRYEHNTSVIRIKPISTIIDKFYKQNGGDGHMCYEIFITDLIDRTSLFFEYPKLKDIKVQIFKGEYHAKPDVAGYFRRRTNVIAIFKTEHSIEALKNMHKTYEEKNPSYLPQIIKETEEKQDKYFNSKYFKGTLLHELQHAIQEIEGFSKGGSTDDMSYEEYYKLGGEIESRDVESRMDLPKDTKYAVIKYLPKYHFTEYADEVAKEDIVGVFNTSKEAWSHYRKYDASWGEGEDTLHVIPFKSRKSVSPLAFKPLPITFDKNK